MFLIKILLQVGMLAGIIVHCFSFIFHEDGTLDVIYKILIMLVLQVSSMICSVVITSNYEVTD